MLRMTFYAILLLVMSSPAWSETEARLLNQSTSGQTVVFSLGTHDGIKTGDYAVIIKQIRDLKTRDLRYIAAARARNIKIFADSSIWILYHIFDQELLVKGDKFVILSESVMLNGRKNLETSRLSIVSSPKDVKKNAALSERNDQDRLGKLNNKYDVMEKTHETPYVGDADAELVDLEIWEKKKNTRYRSSLYKSANKEEFRKQLRLETFEKMVTEYLKRVNDPDFSYDSFYEKQRKDVAMNEQNVHSYNNDYERFLRAEAKKSSADAKLYRSILEKGDSWSEDYSDEELRNVLNNVSVLQEKDRRELVVSKPTRFAMALDYGFALNDTQSDKDTKYKRDNRYSTELDFEVVPFLRHPALERLTFTTSFRLNHTALAVDDFNADLDDYSLSLGANYYPWYNSYSVESPVVFLGTYFRTGYGTVMSPTADEKGNYTVLSLPGFRAGFKYLFKNHFGVRLLFTMETLKLEQYEASKENSVLPDNANLVETKFNAGITYAF